MRAATMIIIVLAAAGCAVEPFAPIVPAVVAGLLALLDRVGDPEGWRR